MSVLHAVALLLCAVCGALAAGENELTLCASPDTTSAIRGCFNENGVDHCFRGANRFNMTAGVCYSWSGVLSGSMFSSLMFQQEASDWLLTGYPFDNCSQTDDKASLTLSSCATSKAHMCCSITPFSLNGHQVETVIVGEQESRADSRTISIIIGVSAGTCCIVCCAVAGYFVYARNRRHKNRGAYSYAPIQQHGHH